MTDTVTTVTSEREHARSIIADRFFDSRYPHYAGHRRDYPRLSEWAEREADEIIDALQGEPDERGSESAVIGYAGSAELPAT